MSARWRCPIRVSSRSPRSPRAPRWFHTQLSFVDIAGLVKGASAGEGLGNQFLGNIREVDAIVHVLRCFEDDDIQHVSNTVDPIADAEVVETELMLADLESLEKRVDNARRRATSGDKEARALVSVLGRALDLLREGSPARLVEPRDEEEARVFEQAQLLTAKPVLYVCNVGEEDAASGNALSEQVFAKAAREGAQAVVVSAAIEAELVAMPPDERREYLAELGLAETGLTRVIRAGYTLCWASARSSPPVPRKRAPGPSPPAPAPRRRQARFTPISRKGFIRAETIAYDDYIALGGEAGAREAGRLRQEGKDYQVADGDVLLFKFNV